MNFDIPYIPERTRKPREKGLTMVMDKGLSINEARHFIESSVSNVDMVQVGFGETVSYRKFKRKN